MAISFNTGATASSGVLVSPTLNITIPAGVLAGDVILVAVSEFSSNVQVIQASSTGTAPVQIGSTVSTASFSTSINNGALFYIVATASDAGKVITVTTQSAVTTPQLAVGLAAYTGASNITPIDVSGSATSAGASATITCPSETTGVSGDWDIQLATAALGGATFSGGAGFTQREAISDASSGSSVLIYDSNASVGGAGTGIGGAVFSNAGHNNWWVGWTVGLAPAAGGSNPSGTVQALPTFRTPRRRPSRAVTQFVPVTTVNVGSGQAGTVQPLTARPAPRRKPARAVVGFTPVTTTNHPAPPPKPQHGTPSSDEARGFKRWLLWGP